MELIELVINALMGAFGYDLTFMIFIALVTLVILLSSISMTRGLMFVSLMAFVVIFSVLNPAISWIMWVLIVISIAMIFIGLKVWFSKIF